MKKTTISLFLFVILALSGTAQVRPIPDCNAISPFIQQQNFDRTKSGFSTSERKIMGLVYKEFGEKLRLYQHPTWSKAGYLAPLAIDARGTVYTAPVAIVSLLDNPLNDHNTLYRVDPITGEMKAWHKLPLLPIHQKGQNPFGILGLSLDCESNFLFTTTVDASDRDNEVGRIYCIKIKDTKAIVTDSLRGIDAMGIGVTYFNGEKRVFFGKTRTSDIYSIALTPEGKFVGQPQYETTLAELGLRGDDRARKIRFTPDGKMTVWGVEFYYNLIAPEEKQETQYYFQYNVSTKTWQNVPQ